MGFELPCCSIDAWFRESIYDGSTQGFLVDEENTGFIAHGGALNLLDVESLPICHPAEGFFEQTNVGVADWFVGFTPPAGRAAPERKGVRIIEIFHARDLVAHLAECKRYPLQALPHGDRRGKNLDRQIDNARDASYVFERSFEHAPGRPAREISPAASSVNLFERRIDRGERCEIHLAVEIIGRMIIDPMALICDV
jgi:hypothetical protein